MSLFPKVQSPCPYKGKFADIMQGNQCRLCKREVIDLTAMDDEGRKAFLDACDTEVCISYRVGAKSALAAMAMSAVAVPTAAAAQDTADAADDTSAGIEEYFDEETMWIIVGGMKKPGDAEWIKDTPKRDHQAGTSALPVEYDDAGTARSKADKPRK
jgi:hypothetical protein